MKTLLRKVSNKARIDLSWVNDAANTDINDEGVYAMFRLYAFNATVASASEIFSSFSFFLFLFFFFFIFPSSPSHQYSKLAQRGRFHIIKQTLSERNFLYHPFKNDLSWSANRSSLALELTEKELQFK